MPTIVDCSLLIGGAFGGYWLWQEIGAVNVTLLAGGGYGSYYVWRQMGTKNMTFVAVGAGVSYIAWRGVRSKLIRLCTSRKTDINIGFREVFKQKFTFLKERNSKINADPKGSDIDYNNVRHLAEKSIEKFIITNELKPYSFSSSTTKATDTVDCHQSYSHQDLDMPYSCNAINSDHVLYMMDINYSYNLQEWLWKGRPILLYSFYPTTVGGDCLEGTFTIREDKITTIYKNGKTYNHQAFDLNMESFVIKGALFSLVVTVDQFVSPMDPNRRVLCLTPTSWYYSVYNWISDQQPNELGRMWYQYGNGNILMSTKKAKNKTVPYVSIGYIGEPEILRLDYDELLNTCMPFMGNELRYNSFVYSLRNMKLETFSPMIFDIIQRGWLKSENRMLAYLKLPETGRFEVEPEKST